MSYAGGQEIGMTKGCGSEEAGWIDRLAAEELPRRKMALLHQHLQQCDACRQRYNRAVLAGRLLEGGPAALEQVSGRELDRVERMVLERARLVPDSAPARRGFLGWVGAAIAVAVVVGIAVPLTMRLAGPPAERPHPGTLEGQGVASEFQARGAPAVTVQPEVGFRALCVQQRENAPVAIVGIEPTTAGGAIPNCPVHDVLRFAYTNKSKLSRLFLVGVNEEFKIKWYEPHPPRERSIRVKSGVIDRPLKRAVRLDVNHDPGLIRVYALFSAEPLTASEVTRAVAQAQRSGRSIVQVDKLPVKNAVQQSLLMRLSSEK